MDIMNICAEGNTLLTIVNMFTLTVALDFVASLCAILRGSKI